MLRTLAIFGTVALIAGFFSVIYVFACEDDWCAVFGWQKVKLTSNFEECVSLGFPVTESSPRECRAGEKTFIEAIPEVDPFQKQFELETTTYEIPQYSSGIRGKVMIGPTCPVISPETQKECENKPYKTELRIYDTEKNLIKVVPSDSNGNFEIGLSPGSYIVDSDGKSVMPTAEPQIVLVEKDKFTDIIFTFDSGIR